MTKTILHIFSTLELGGPQRRFLDLLPHSDSDVRHVCFAMDGNYTALKNTNIERADFSPFSKGALLKSIVKARKHLADVRPDLLLTYNWGATEWAIAARTLGGVRYVHIQDGFGKEEFEKEKLRRKILRRIAMKGARAVVVPSLTLFERARENWGLKPPKLVFIPNGVNTAAFKCDADQNALKELGLKERDKLITIVAGLRPEKNVGRLIEAFVKVADTHHDVKLLIIGEGIGHSALTMLAERVGLSDRVVFAGLQSDVSKFLPASRIFALSSDTEQMPLSVVEAMAASLPVVSTNVGDIRRMVVEENRPYIKGMRAQDLAEALIDLLDMPEKARDIGQQNREKAAMDYDISRMIAAWNQLYRDNF